MENESVTTENFVNGAAAPKFTLKTSDEAFKTLVDVRQIWLDKRWSLGKSLDGEQQKKAFSVNYHCLHVLEVVVSESTTVHIPSAVKIASQLKDFFLQFGFCQYNMSPNVFYLMFELPRSFLTRYLRELSMEIVTKVLFNEITSPNFIQVKAVRTNNKSLTSMFNAFTNQNFRFAHINMLASQFVVDKQTVDQSNQLYQMHKHFKHTFARHFSTMCVYSGSFNASTPGTMTYVKSLDGNARRTYLRWTMPQVILSNLQETAFQVAMIDLQNESCTQDENSEVQISGSFKEFETHVSDIHTKATVIREALNAELKQLFLRSLYSDPSNPGSFSAVHPHALAMFATKSDDYLAYSNLTINLVPYYGDYILQLLIVSNWFAKVIISNEDNIDNNQAALLFFGTAGAGKSKIVKALFDALNGYNWHKGEYQSPDFVECSILSFEELMLENMLSSQYKNVFDFNGSERVNVKCKDPIDGTMHMPVVTSTNQNPYDKFRELTGGRVNQARQDEVLGGFRRLLPVPFVFSIKEKYLDVNCVEEVWKNLHAQFLAVTNEQLFNTIFALALCNTRFEDKGVDIPSSLLPYANAILKSFKNTHFGALYTRSKRDIDAIVNGFMIQSTDYKGVSSNDISLKFMSAVSAIEGVTDQYCLSLLFSAGKPQLMQVYQSQSIKFLKKVRLCNMEDPLAVTDSEYHSLVSPKIQVWLKSFYENQIQLQFFDSDDDDQEYDDKCLRESLVKIPTLSRQNAQHEDSIMPSIFSPIIRSHEFGVLQSMVPAMPQFVSDMKHQYGFSNLLKRTRTFAQEDVKIAPLCLDDENDHQDPLLGVPSPTMSEVFKRMKRDNDFVHPNATNGN